MTRPSTARETRRRGEKFGIEVHGDTLRKRVTLNGKREWITHLPGCLKPTHAFELDAYCERLREADKRGEPRPTKPWEPAADDPSRNVRRGMTFYEYVTEVVVPRWEQTLTKLDYRTVDQRIRHLTLHVLHAFRPDEPNWTTAKPLDQVTYFEVERWMERRKDELVAARHRAKTGAPTPQLPGPDEYPRVREWARAHGIPRISDHGRPPHVVLELYRAAHSNDPAVPAAPFMSKPTAIGHAVWLAREVFNEALKDARVLGVELNPIATLTLGEFGRRTGVHKEAPMRQAAGVDEIRRLAARLHPAHRLPFWLGIIMALRLGESFGLPVRLWDWRNQVIRIEQQFGEWRETRDGPLRFIKDWVKTPASKAHLWVPNSLAAFMTSEIERVYGHRLDDPWWDEPVEDPWDPLIKTNRDQPICVHPLGPDFHAAVRRSFALGLQEAAELEGIDLTALGEPEDDGTVQTHDLRRTISALIHAKSWATDRTRSAYLRHQHKGTWEDSKVTARHYTAVVKQGLIDLAATLEREFIPQLGPLAAPPPTTGADRLVTIEEVGRLIGLPGAPLASIRERVRRRGIQPVHNPWGYGATKYYRAGDLDAFAPPADKLTTTQAIALLWCDADRMPDGALRNRLRRYVGSGRLLRAGRLAREALYDKASVLGLAELHEQRRSGVLMLRSDASAEFCLPGAFTFVSHGIDVIELDIDGPFTAGGYVRRADVEAYVTAQRSERVWTVRAIAREFQVSFDTAKRLVTVAPPEHVDPQHINDDAVAYLRKHFEHLLTASWNVPEVERPPRGETWVSAEEGARQLGIQEETLRRRARSNHWPAVRYHGQLYVTRRRLRERPVPAGYVPLGEIQDRLDKLTREEARRLARSEWMSMEVGPHQQLFVDQASVKNWLTREIEGQRLLRSTDAAHRLGVGRGRFQQLVLTGTLKPKLVARGLFANAPEVRLFDPGRLDRLREAHTPPAGWMRMVEAAALCGITPTGLEWRATRNGWAVVVDFGGRKWVDPAVAVTAPADVTGLFRISEVLERLGLPTTESFVRRVQKLAQDGTWPSVVRAVAPGTRGSAWWFPDDPDLFADLRQRLHATTPVAERMSQASRSFHAAVRELQRASPSVPPTTEPADGAEQRAAG